MKLFTYCLTALIFLEILECLGRPNYNNAVIVFSIYLAILVDLRNSSGRYPLARSALQIAMVILPILIFLDIWYLIYGSLVNDRLSSSKNVWLW